MWKWTRKSRSKEYAVDDPDTGRAAEVPPDPAEEVFDVPSFLMAAKNGDNEKISYYLHSRESDINAGNRRGNTALHIASIHGQLDTVKHLLQNGANVNHQSKHGYTALYNAAMENHPELVKELLANGADRSLSPLLRGKSCSPLEIAQLQGFSDIVAILKEEVQQPEPEAEADVGETGL